MKINRNGITLIALIITIVVLLILAGVSITAVFSDNGLVTRARWSAFVTELSEVKEKAILKENNHATDLYLELTTEVSPFTKYSEANIQEQLGISSLPKTLENEMTNLGTNKVNLYIIDKQTGSGKEKTYLWDDNKKIVYKINGIHIYGNTIHSIEAGEEAKNNNTTPPVDIPENKNVATMDVQYTYGYYEPDLNGFDADRTYAIYYSTDWSSYKEVLVKDYISGGKQKTIEEEGVIYTFYDYNQTSGNSTWGNIKTYANGQEAWWTWIPRYAYDTSNMNKSPAEGESAIKIKFITTDNKYIIDEGGTYVSKDDVTSPDIAHPSFTLKNGDTIEKELYGIWMSKYEPSLNTNSDVVSDSSYVGAKHYMPDMTGFDKEQTYLLRYDETGTTITSEDLLKDIGTTDSALKQYSNDTTSGLWFDYSKKIWANIKTTANNQEAYWVWIPRYAYSLGTTSKDISIIFIDLNNEPMDKTSYPNGLPTGYIVHPAFNPDESTSLKGIWMSKYEPSKSTELKNATNNVKCYAPNLVGYNVDNTWIETYDENGENIVTEYKLRDVLKTGANIDSNNILTSGEVDESKITNGIWYDYGKRIWANIKTKANNLEAWWTWIPRYAYSLQSSSKEINVIFIGIDDIPIDKEAYPDGLLPGYIIQPAFNPDESTKLKGIWMSKYEPSGEPTSEEKTLN